MEDFELEPRKRRPHRCSDGLCGALDCERCFPGRPEEDDEDVYLEECCLVPAYGTGAFISGHRSPAVQAGGVSGLPSTAHPARNSGPDNYPDARRRDVDDQPAGDAGGLPSPDLHATGQLRQP